MQVLKFGGTSVANATNMSKVVDIVTKAVSRDRTILVCSAISKCTDTLIEIGRRAASGEGSYRNLIDDLQEKHHAIISELLPTECYAEVAAMCDDIFSDLRAIAHGVCLVRELSATSLDAIQGCGELLSTKIIAKRFALNGIRTLWVDSRDIIRTRVVDNKTLVDTTITYAAVQSMVGSNPDVDLFVVPGFIASNESGRATTLGRGGSDYSASLYAVGIKAKQVEIWTDVTGMMTSNPKVAPAARTIEFISYRAALELSHFGAKVIYPPTIYPVVAEEIPIYVKNTFEPDAFGTLIEKEARRRSTSSNLIGISNSDNIALLSLEGSGMVGVPNFSSRLFAALSQQDINIILITQASSVHTMCIAIAEKDAEKAKEAADKCFEYEISLGKINPLKVEKGFSIVCLVGDDVIGHSRVTGRMLAALGRSGITVRATAQGSSERNISVIVPSDSVNEAILQLHKEFFESNKEKVVNVFIAGYGVIGKTLVKMIAENAEKIAQRTGSRLVVKGISNSRRFALNTRGLDLSKVDELLSRGQSAEDGSYFEALSNLSLGHAVFVDCTAGQQVTSHYRELLRGGYNIVACNKLAFAAPYSSYSLLKKTAAENGRTLRYETTVGAALPILRTISCGFNSGDSIEKVEAVLSGTLNYIFSTYQGGRDGVSFAQVVRKAQESGYTEPDPRQDLSGNDVLRKLTIIAREAGIALEQSDVEIKPILAPEYFEGSVEQFYALLEKNEASFAASFEEAASKGLKQRVIASLVADSSSPLGYKASIAVGQVDEQHPLYTLNGTDNCAIIRSAYYPNSLVIKGAGAGANQTANGVLADILNKYI